MTRAYSLLLLLLASPAGLSAPAFADDNFLDRAAVQVSQSPRDIAEQAVLSKDEDVAVLDETLATIFQNAPPTLAEPSALRILAYIAQVFKSGPSPVYLKTGTAVLQAKTNVNLCGSKALVMVALCRRVGFPAHRISMRNSVAIDEHIATEVHYDNAWHFMDPSFGAFFYTKKTYNGQGRILSLLELKTRKERAAHGLFVGASRLWKGVYDPAFAFEPVPPGFQPEPWQRFTVAEMYRRLFAESFPLMRSESGLVSMPIQFDLRAGPDLWIGRIDRDTTDARTKPAGEPTPRFYGNHAIGNGDLGGAFHTLLIMAPRPGPCRITYHFPTPYPGASLTVIELKDVVVAATAQTPESWSVDCYVQDTEGILLVANRGPGALLVDAFHGQFFGEQPGQGQ